MNEVKKVAEYKDFDYKQFPLEVMGWQGDNPELINRIARRVSDIKDYIEVGVWKGESLINIGKYLVSKNPDVKIHAVDTWLGSSEFWVKWTGMEPWDLKLEFGYPNVYKQFLANIFHVGLENNVIPYPMTSNVAAMYMDAYKIRADLIYIDASHLYDDVLKDMQAYWKLLRNDNSILFGHDWGMTEVQSAVRTFCLNNAITNLHSWGQLWMIIKGENKS